MVAPQGFGCVAPPNLFRPGYSSHRQLILRYSLKIRATNLLVASHSTANSTRYVADNVSVLVTDFSTSTSVILPSKQTTPHRQNHLPYPSLTKTCLISGKMVGTESTNRDHGD